MTGNRYILNENAEVEDTSTRMTFDSFTEILTILNGQDALINEQAIQLDYLKAENNHMRAVLEENKRLKHECNYLQNRLDDFICIENKLKRVEKEVNDCNIYRDDLKDIVLEIRCILNGDVE